MEGHVRTWHNIHVDQHFIKGSTALRIPSFTMVIGCTIASDDGEMIRDILLIKRRNLLNGCPACALSIACAVVSLAVIPIVVISIACQLDILAVNQSILHAAATCSFSVRMILEGQRILITIPIDVDDGVALRSNLLAGLVGLLEGEACLASVSCARYAAGIVSGRRDGGRRRADSRVLDDDRFDKVIAVAGQILFPDQDGVVGRLRGSPLGIDRCSIGDRTAEAELFAVGAGRVGVPSAEGIAVADHLDQASIARHLAVLNETRGVIGRALAVFVKDKPVALRCDCGKGHVALDGHGSTIFKKGVGRRAGRDDVAESLYDLPTFKVVRVVCRKALVDGIGGVRFPAGDLDRLRSDDNKLRSRIVKIDRSLIGDLILLEHRSIIGNAAVSGQGCRLGHGVRTDVRDGHHRGVLGVILLRSPALEDLACGDGAGTRIVDDLLDLGRRVLCLYIHGGDFGRAVHELDRQTRDHGLNHDVNGEVLCREADSIVVGGYGRHKLAAVAALVINLQRLSIAERIIFDGDRDGFFRLPALTVLIKNGDIVGSENRLVGRGSAGRALGGSSTIDALENHLRLGCALLDSGHAAAYRQKAVNTDIAGGQSLLFGLDGLLGGGLFSRGCRDFDQTDTGGRIAHRNGREIAFAGDDLQLAALHTAVQRDESKRLALFKRRHRLDADSQLEILAFAADRPAFKNGSSLDGSDGNALQHGHILIGGIATLGHSDGIFALALVAVRCVDGLFDLDDGLFGGLGCDLGRRLGCDLGRRLGCDLGRRLGCNLGLIRLFSRIRILRKLDHIIILVSAVVQAGGQGLIAGPQYHQQGKQKREYALRQFVHLMRASYSLRGGGSRRRALFTALWVLLVRCHWVLLCTLRLLCCLQ